MKITDKEYKVLMNLPEKSRIEWLIKKHILFQHRVEEFLGIEVCDAIWDEINQIKYNEVK